MNDIEKKPTNTSILNGVYEIMSELIGFDNVLKLYENFRGSQVNFPTRLFSKEFVLQEALRLLPANRKISMSRKRHPDFNNRFQFMVKERDVTELRKIILNFVKRIKVINGKAKVSLKILFGDIQIENPPMVTAIV